MDQCIPVFVNGEFWEYTPAEWNYTTNRLYRIFQICVTTKVLTVKNCRIEDPFDAVASMKSVTFESMDEPIEYWFLNDDEIEMDEGGHLWLKSQ